MRAALALVVLAATASAQAPDTTGVLAAPVGEIAAADSAALPRPSVAPFGPAPGRAITPVPAVAASLSVARLVGGVATDVVTVPGPLPAVFGYDLAAPGRVAGVTLDGQAPDAPAVTLDGRPYDDPFTGAPRLDLLPLAALGPVRLGDGARGRPTSLAARVRGFRLGVPITELRYLGGRSGLFHASGTHAQTRRPPAFLRGGSDDARLTGTFHAASRGARGPLAGSRLRHTDALGRLLLTRPGLAAEVGVVYADRTEGARLGVVPDTPSQDGVFSFETATPLEPDAERQSQRVEGWARARVPVASRPAEVGASVAVQRLAYTPDATASAGPVRVRGTRVAAFAEQPAVVGPHRLAVRGRPPRRSARPVGPRPRRPRRRAAGRRRAAWLRRGGGKGGGGIAARRCYPDRRGPGAQTAVRVRRPPIRPAANVEERHRPRVGWRKPGGPCRCGRRGDAGLTPRARGRSNRPVRGARPAGRPRHAGCGLPRTPPHGGPSPPPPSVRAAGRAPPSGTPACPARLAPPPAASPRACSSPPSPAPCCSRPPRPRPGRST